MAGSTNRVRIIAGQFRGRRLAFENIEGLRPTPDRVRETLFNWLQPHIEGLRCLDLFAGSGVLGLEALSRGACALVMVERHPRQARRLREQLTPFQSAGATLIQADALAWLRQEPARAFDLIFLDPPFAQGLLEPAMALIERHGWLAPRGWVYVESASEAEEPQYPENWQIIKQQVAGQVRCRLLRQQLLPETALFNANGGLSQNQ